ncbi:unnamed protein product [Clonostachys rhizophaga]|uniref:F-box domain-containing protein n=1 Tax=Clonostachys rhizophaga TaxID=160324 RepID=A0A9N9YRZ9_9HYPO|nr:unnamed protein product [Clonostachys rhizophaga]
MVLHIPGEILIHTLRHLIPPLYVPSTSARRPFEEEESQTLKLYRSLRPKDLSSLSRVSRRLYHIAQPLLYHTINLIYETTNGPNQHEWPSLLLRTITKHPHLAKHIRFLAITSSVSTADWSTIGFPWDVPYTLRRTLEPELKGNHAGPIALLLYATMIKKLILLSNDPEDIWNYMIITSWRPQGNPPYMWVEPNIDLTPKLGPFANHGHAYLKDLHLEADGEEWSLTDRVLADIINKPGLSTLSINGGFKALDFFNNELPAHLLPEDWPPSLEVIRLTNCYVDTRSFEYILRHCPKLIVLSIHLAKAKWTIEGQSFIPAASVSWALNLEQMGQALRNYGGNITTLHLDFSQYKLTHTPIGRIGPVSSMTSLRHLQCYRNDLIITQGLNSGGFIANTSLEHCDLPLESVLPPSLATLDIRYEQYCVPSSTLLSPPRDILSTEIESILSSGRLQSLRQIRVQIHHFDSPDSGSTDSVFLYSGSSEFDSADSDASDELILFQTKIPGWSFESKRTLRKVQNGFIEYMSMDRTGVLEVFHG